MTYSTIADWKTYASARGQTDIAAADDADLTTALRRGSEAEDARYEHKFPGVRTDGRDQTRAWPRKMSNGDKVTDAFGQTILTTAVPDEVIRAAYELARAELTTPGSLAPQFTPITRVKSTSEAVGPLSEETTYFDVGGSDAAQMPVLTIVDGVLAPLIGVKSNTTSLKRM